MGSQLIGTLKLMGDDSVYFFNSLFRPTDEEIRHHDELIKKIDNDIKIIETHDGFTAEIEDLDLSFMNSYDNSVELTTFDEYDVYRHESYESFKSVEGLSCAA